GLNRAACDGGEPSSPSNPRSQPLPSSAPSSRRQPSVDDRDDRGATFRDGACDDGDRSSLASSLASKCRRATIESRSGLPAAPGPESPTRGLAVSASVLPSSPVPSGRYTKDR